MKSLSKNDIKAFLERFDNATGGEIVSFNMISPVCFKVSLTAQDKNRAFDWVNLNFEASGVKDAKLLSDSALKAVDMEQGINISFQDDGIEIGFGADEYEASPLRLKADTLKFEESSFSI